MNHKKKASYALAIAAAVVAALILVRESSDEQSKRSQGAFESKRTTVSLSSALRRSAPSLSSADVDKAKVSSRAATGTTRQRNRKLAAAQSRRQSDVQVSGHGKVIKILPDDNRGSRHQRFLIHIGTARTVLIAHNIDLAPRIDSLRQGDEVEFFGEFEWNDKGGVIHWTHRDPRKRHPHGWITHQGKRYW